MSNLFRRLQNWRRGGGSGNDASVADEERADELGRTGRRRRNFSVGQIGEIRLRSLEPTRIRIFYVWFLRIFAMFALLWGLSYWAALMGLGGDPRYRFDLAPLHWRMAASALAALYPFASAGLWMLASWGPVIYGLCAAIEIAMFALSPALFGSRPLLVLTHLLVIGLFVAFRIVLWRQDRRAEEER